MQEEAPDLAAVVRARFAANLHHVLGTIRPDGSPRLSGTEVRIDDDAIGLGMMAGSRKLADVRRDPRVELHSAPLETDLAEGDVKLSGRLEVVEELTEPPGTMFALELTAVSRVRVDGDELELTVWHPGGPARTLRRR